MSVPAPTADEVLAAATPLTKSVPVCLRGDLLARIDEIAEEYSAALVSDKQTNDLDRAPEILAELRAAKEAADAAAVTFRFVAIPSPEWAKLLGQHKDPAGQLAFNPATFPPAAIAASLVEPTGFDLDKVQQLERAVNDGQWKLIWGTCLEVNRGEGDLPKYDRLFALIDGSAPRSTTAPTEGSGTPSS